jgi:RNA polymerase sigma factor (sigma-70 family)
VTWLGPETVVDDATVVERSWQEPMCFGILFDRHAPSIYRYIARRVGRDAIDDLVAETFIGAFSSRLHYNLAYRDARPWLYGIATHVIGSHRREELRQFRISQAVWSAGAVLGHADSVAADMTAQSMSEPLATALSALVAGDRDVLILLAWEQLTYEEVARALDIPVGTVRSRLHRARASVQEALASLGTLATVVEVLHND